MARPSLALRAVRSGLMLAVLVVAVAAVPRGAEPAAAGEPKPPNVLIILTDDHRATGTLQMMPAVQKWFFGQGTRFTNGYATTPVCCPSRSTIMTGQYSHNHGVRTNKDRAQLDHDTTIQAYLDQAGYNTGIVGKMLNGWTVKEDPPHFDRWAVMAPGDYVRTQFNVEGRRRRVDRYSTDFIAAYASRLIRDFEDDDAKPWYLYVTPLTPHKPFIIEKEYRNESVGRWNGNPAVRERNRTDKPEYVQNRDATLTDGREIRAQQLRMLPSADDLVSQLFRTMGRNGEKRRTLAFFLGDNGYLWGEHGLKAKSFPYLESVRLPFAMRWPGHVEAGAVDRRLVANVDVAPTIVDAAGANVDFEMDGWSLLGPHERDRLLLEAWPETPTPNWAALLTDGYHYIETYDDDTGELTFREYYDLENDPWELVNLLGDGRVDNDPPAGSQTSLRLQVARDRQCAGTSGPSACP
jgi:arylsulfatase A-like enzyme